MRPDPAKGLLIRSVHASNVTLKQSVYVSCHAFLVAVTFHDCLEDHMILVPEFLLGYFSNSSIPRIASPKFSKLAKHSSFSGGKFGMFMEIKFQLALIWLLLSKSENKPAFVISNQSQSFDFHSHLNPWLDPFLNPAHFPPFQWIRAWHLEQSHPGCQRSSRSPAARSVRAGSACRRETSGSGS